MRRASIRLSMVAILLGLAAAYAQPSAEVREVGQTCRADAASMARLELLFGTLRRNSPPVSEEEWASFLEAEVTPRFPDGLTVLSGYGQWRGNDGVLAKERSIVLVIWYTPNARTEADIEAIRSAYKQRFNQQSVMRVDSVSCVSF
jgi:hypothetical protein